MLTQGQIAAAWRPPCRGPWVRIQYPGEGSVLVRPAATEAFRAKAMVCAAFGYRTRKADSGGYVCRTTATGASSRHAEAIADDLNWNSNPYGTTRTDRPRGMNAAIVAIRTKNGKQVFNNGIFWRGNKDPMHDEIVCSPADLATGIDWRTVAGSGSKPPVTPAPTPTPTPEKPAPQLLGRDNVDLVLDNSNRYWLVAGSDREQVAGAEVHELNAALPAGRSYSFAGKPAAHNAFHRATRDIDVRNGETFTTGLIWGEVDGSKARLVDINADTDQLQDRTKQIRDVQKDQVVPQVALIDDIAKQLGVAA